MDNSRRVFYCSSIPLKILAGAHRRKKTKEDHQYTPRKCKEEDRVPAAKAAHIGCFENAMFPMRVGKCRKRHLPTPLWNKFFITFYRIPYKV